MKIILQKIIASSGYSSRRQAEKLIRAGQVTVNGLKATVGDMADSRIDKISVKGHLVGAAAKKIYIKLNKPLGYTCTNRNFAGEKNIFDLVRVPERLFAVGRLDKDSRGLILLTNDGELTQRLAHPRFEHEKIYEVKVNGRMSNRTDKSAARDWSALTKKLISGVNIGAEDGLVRVKNAKHLQNGLFIITLNEGKKRQIRRMFEVLGLVVIDLRRIELAGLKLGDLKEGRWEYLKADEINKLKI